MDTRTDCVLFDHAPGMTRVVAHLAGLGHRRIALIVSQSPNRPIRRRVEGFRAGHKAQGLALDETLVVHLPTAMSPAFETVQALLRRADRPTAIVAMGTNILNDTLNAINANALRIPHDISLVSIGDPDFASTHVPPISSLRVDLDEVAEVSCELLLSRMRGEAGEAPRTIHITNAFVERASCGPAKA
jgi:LacI family transcriptional regulator